MRVQRQNSRFGQVFYPFHLILLTGVINGGYFTPLKFTTSFRDLKIFNCKTNTMSFNLLDIVKGQFNNELVSKVASFLGENESGVTKALSGVLPSVLSGMVSKGSSSTAGAGELLNLAKETHSSGMFSNLGSLLNGGSLLSKGGDLLQSLLGDKVGSVVKTIAGFAGIKDSSVSNLMSLAAPAALSTVGKHAINNNLSANGLMDLLSSQKSTIMNALPAGLPSLAGLLGIGKITDISGTTTRKVAAGYDEVERKAGNSMKWLLPLLALLAAGLLIMWLLSGGMRGCNAGKNPGKDTTQNASISTEENSNAGDVNNTLSFGKLDTLTGDFVYNLGNIITIELPNNGGKLEVGENSTEAKLVKFLNDNSQTIDTVKGNWFEFTNVRFKTGSSEITEESMAQLKNMVMIAKSYPNAKFKFGGYTDNTGDSLKNIALSQKRAEVVEAKVKELGAPANSLSGAKGYGPNWPIGDNNTPEGRAMNRRVAVNVKAK
jgi:outer membrane protein OmpA-like peptidoglycan-associated protein